MSLIDTFTNFELAILFCVIPGVFVFLWALIFGDFKNFIGSRKAYSEFSATDPVNCYQNFVPNKKDN